MTDRGSLPRDKAELLARMERARASLERTVGALSEAQLAAPGAEGWSVKDHLAHLSAWERGIAALLRGRLRYEAMGVDLETYLANDEDGLNAILYEQHKGRTASEALAALRKAHAEVVSALAELSDADLFRTYSHYQPEEPGEDTGEPVLKWVAGNTYEHYEEHEGWIRELVE